MKTLYLVRHAKSSWDYDLNDFDRPLNKRGEFDAPLMGKTLSDKGIKPDYLLSSPASRAIKTATIIAEKIKYDLPIGTLHTLYHASAANMLQVVRNINNEIKTLMIFGHNPGLTSFANQLTTEPVENIPTCGIYAVKFAVEKWHEIAIKKGKPFFFDFPKNHKK
ncbi:MAG: SixA phosphatase family protein [Cyclobacteriaceae bacterium]